MSDLSSAICAYLQYKNAAWPQTDWRAVVTELGSERATAIEIPMLLVLAELRECQPDWRTHDLVSASEWAVREVRARHSAIDDRAAKALFWLFSFENK